MNVNHPVRLDVAEFDKLCAGEKWHNDAERARGLGVKQPTVRRVRRREGNPGSLFIDSCIRTFGPEHYFKLFKREGVDRERATA